MRPSHNGGVWKERFDPNDAQKMKKIRQRISVLNAKFVDASVKISLDISGSDLLVTYQQQ
jgi:hypothetical protein